MIKVRFMVHIYGENSISRGQLELSKMDRVDGPTLIPQPWMGWA
jgi:hypothetical protein